MRWTHLKDSNFVLTVVAVFHGRTEGLCILHTRPLQGLTQDFPNILMGHAGVLTAGGQVHNRVLDP